MFSGYINWNIPLNLDRVSFFDAVATSLLRFLQSTVWLHLTKVSVGSSGKKTRHLDRTQARS